MTALHWAAQHGHHGVTEALIKHGADVHALSKFDKTPFDIAVDIQNTELMLLLQVGTLRLHHSSGLLHSHRCVCVCVHVHPGGHAEPGEHEPGELEPGEHECGNQQLHQPATVHHPGDSCHPGGRGQPDGAAQQG